jgi:outer membrane protein TolC
MLNDIHVDRRMEHTTTSHGADAVSNPKTRGVKSGLYAALAFVVFVEGCSVGPRYKAPTPTIRPFHNPAPTRADGASAPPLDTWWEGFGDPALTRIVQRALDQNLDLAASVTRVEQARAAAKGAGARLKPSGALNAQSTSDRHSRAHAWRLKGQRGLATC